MSLVDSIHSFLFPIKKKKSFIFGINGSKVGLVPQFVCASVELFFTRT